jgi:hypothetical protein
VPQSFVIQQGVKISKDESPKRATIHTQSSDNAKLVFLTLLTSASRALIKLDSSAMNANMIEHIYVCRYSKGKIGNKRKHWRVSCARWYLFVAIS